MPKDDKFLLLVEDEPLYIDMVKEQLENAGITVEVANNGKDALKVLETKKPGLILLDLVMPVMNGFDFLKKMHKNKDMHDVPVVILSNLCQDIDKDQCDQYNVKEFVVKVEVGVDQVVATAKKYLK
jgi:CheY-like chemotaxis protein